MCPSGAGVNAFHTSVKDGGGASAIIRWCAPRGFLRLVRSATCIAVAMREWLRAALGMAARRQLLGDKTRSRDKAIVREPSFFLLSGDVRG